MGEAKVGVLWVRFCECLVAFGLAALFKAHCNERGQVVAKAKHLVVIVATPTPTTATA